MVKRQLFEDEVGAVTADWLTLTAGIVLLGLMVVFSIMNSAGYLMSEFDDLNDRFATSDDLEPVASGGTAAASASIGGPGPYTVGSGGSASASSASANSASMGIEVRRRDGLESAAAVDTTAIQNGQEQSDAKAEPGSDTPR